MMGQDLTLIAAAVLLAMLAIGCGNEALKINASVAHAMLEIQSASGPAIREARVNAAISAGQSAHDEGETEDVAQQRAASAAGGWQCAIDGHGIYAAAVGAYIDALSLWSAGKDFELADAFPFLGAAVEAYAALRSCIDSLSSSSEPIELESVPENPSFLNIIPPAWGMGVPGVE